jgi:hypothetical protein
MTKNTSAENREKTVKKQYVKPKLEVIELRSDERIAGPSNENCAACQGAHTCAPGGLHGEGQ